jgi:fumarate reductase flavoprotein subunit
MKTEFDVIVVGGGGSGLSAAVSAAENGADVLILEKHVELGGATGIAVGSLTANRTRIQSRAGVIDTLDDHVEDAGKFAAPEIEALNNKELRRWFLDQSADTLHWLMSMGLNFYGPNPEPPNRVPRMHNVIPGAKAYITVLHARLIKLGGTVITNAPVLDLLVGDGRITGVNASVNGLDSSFYARKGVVLAAGDYANSLALITRFKGEQFSKIEGISERARGDGHLLAEKAGAKLINMSVTYGPELRFIPIKTKTFQQLLPTRGPLSTLMGLFVPLMPQFLMNMMIKRLLVTWQHPENSLFTHGAILINQDGNRFCRETESPHREIEIANQPGKMGYILLDRTLTEKFSQWPDFISTAPKIGYAFVKDYLKLRPDVAFQGSSLASIAQKRSLPLENFQKAYSESNLGDGPWVLLGPVKAYFTTTEGGVMIDQNFHALDQSGKPIPGLFAVGQNGLGGQILWGHGLHIAWAMTSGRLVGKQFAQKNAV